MTTSPDGFTLPTEWSTSARETFSELLTARPDLAGADLAGLEQACALITAADTLDAVAREAGYITTGSTGQVIAHPAAVEARLTRTAAASILARLAATPASGVMTGSQRGSAAARARWSRP